MSITEELEHKKVQAIYLRKLLENVNEEIDELENIDPYAELRAAHAAGKRIFFINRLNKWVLCERPVFIDPIEKYKIVDDDETYICTYWNYFVKGNIKVKITKCGLTGDVTAEVVE